MREFKIHILKSIIIIYVYKTQSLVYLMFYSLIKRLMTYMNLYTNIHREKIINQMYMYNMYYYLSIFWAIIVYENENLIRHSTRKIVLQTQLVIENFWRDKKRSLNAIDVTIIIKVNTLVRQIFLSIIEDQLIWYRQVNYE